MTIIRVSQARLAELLMRDTAHKIVRFRARTIPRMRKRDNRFFGNCWKTAIFRGRINFIYEKRCQQFDPDFEAGPRQWGEKVQGASAVVYPQIQNWQRLYAEVEVTQSIKYEYRDRDDYLLDKRSVHRYTYPARDRFIRYRNYAIRNILSIDLYGNTYQRRDVKRRKSQKQIAKEFVDRVRRVFFPEISSGQEI